MYQVNETSQMPKNIAGSLLCSVLCLVLANVLYFKRAALLLGTMFFEQGLLNKNYTISDEIFVFNCF